MPELKNFTLQNGLPVCFIPANEYKTYTILFMAGVGYRFETPENNGISRFLLNTLFQGTKDLPDKEKVSRAIDSLGVNLRVNVASEYSYLLFNTLEEAFLPALQFLGQLVCQPTFDPESIEKERKIVLAEIALSEKLPQQKAFNSLKKLVFGSHPLGFSKVGIKDAVQPITQEKILQFYKTHFKAGNCLLVVLGPGELNFQQTAEQALGQLPSGERQAFSPFDFSNFQPKNETISGMGNIGYIALGGLCYPRMAPEKEAQSLLVSLLTSGRNNQWFMALRRKKLVSAVRPMAAMHSDCGFFSVLATGPKFTTQNAQTEINTMFGKLTTQLVSEEELAAAKKIHKNRLLTVLERSTEKTLFYGSRLFFGSGELDPDEINAKVDKVTAQDLQKAAQAIFNPAGLCWVTTGF